MATFFALCTGCVKAGKRRKIKAACEIPKATRLPAARGRNLRLPAPAAETCADFAPSLPAPRPELAPTRRPRPELAPTRGRNPRLPAPTRAYPRPEPAPTRGRNPRLPAPTRGRNLRLPAPAAETCADFAPSLPAPRPESAPTCARGRNPRLPAPAAGTCAYPRPPKTTSAASPFGKSSALKLTPYLLLCLATMAFIISIFCSISATSFSWVRARSRL